MRLKFAKRYAPTVVSRFSLSLPSLAILCLFQNIVSPQVWAQEILDNSSSQAQVIQVSSQAQKTNLDIASSVTTILDFGTSQTLSLDGNFINHGTVIFASSNPNIHSATLQANAIHNTDTGIISGSFQNLHLSAPIANILLNFFTIDSVKLISATDILNNGIVQASSNLTLTAQQSIMNSGTIASTGDMTLNAAAIFNSGSIIANQNINLLTNNLNNSSNINSVLANINISQSILSDLLINNISGNISALNGQINIRDSIFSGITALNISGGNLLAKELNLNNGQGNILAHLNSISGIVNTYGSAAYLEVLSGQLNLGQLKIDGDPTYFNNTGSITLNGDIQVAANLAIIAAGDIISTANTKFINTNNAFGQGNNIYLIAGASVQAGANPSTNTVPPLNNFANTNVSIDPTTYGLGGDINFAASPNLKLSSASTCAGCNGGNIVLAAYANSATNTGGRIIFNGPSPGNLGSEINSSSLSGAAGNIAIFAGATASNVQPNIQLPRITAIGADKINGGQVSIHTAQPSSDNGANLITFDPNGNIISGNNFAASANYNKIDVDLNDNISANNLIVNAGGHIKTVDALIEQINLGALAHPTSTAITANGQFVFSIDPINLNLYKIDTSTNTLLSSTSINNLVLPSAIVISPDNKRLYIADSTSNLIYVFDAQNPNNQLAVFSSQGNQPISLALNKDGSQIFVGNSASQTITSFNTNNFLPSMAAIATPGTFNTIVFNEANSTLYAGINNGSNGIFGFDTINKVAIPFVNLSDSPTSIGNCPCGTKMFVPVVSAGSANITEVSLIGAPQFNISLSAGVRNIDSAILANGAYAYFADPNSGLQIIQTVTSSVKTVVPIPNPINNNNGQFVGFVNHNPVAYIPNTNAISVVRTPVLNVSTLSLNSLNESISATVSNVANLSTTSAKSTVLSSNTNLTTTGSGASAGTVLQYATIGSLAIDAPVSAKIIDMHALYGTFSNANNNSFVATGGLLALASSNIVNNGLLQALSPSGADAILFAQAPNGKLNLNLGNSGVLFASGDNSGLIRLNPAQGQAINVIGSGLIRTDSGGQQGSGLLQFNGNTEHYSVQVNAQEIQADLEISKLNNPFGTHNKPSLFNVTTQMGDINLFSPIDTSSTTGSGGNINLYALNGMVQTSINSTDSPLISDASGSNNRAGNITVYGAQGINLLGKISADGLNGANAGNVFLQSPDSFIALCNCNPESISARAIGGGNGGLVILQAQDLFIDSIDLNGNSIDVSAPQGTAGRISISTFDQSNPLVIGCPACNSIAGNIRADGQNGGRIDIFPAGGFASMVTTEITANGSSGAGGIIQILSLPGQTLIAEIDGLINAQNNADNSGIVSFNSQSNAAVQLSSPNTSGIVHAGSTVAFGNLDPNTALPYNPIYFPATNNFQYANISANLGFSIIGNTIAVNATSSFTPSQTNGQRVTLPNFQNNISLLADTTIVATDQTPQSKESTINRQNLLPMTQISSYLPAAFATSANLDFLKNQAVSVRRGADENSIYLDEGNVLFFVKESTRVYTPQGMIKLNPGNIVFLIVDSRASMILNLHDDLFNSPIVYVDNKLLKLNIGQEIDLIKLSNSQINDSQNDLLNPSLDHKISMRQDKTIYNNGNLLVRSSQFSLTSALSNISLFRKNNNNPNSKHPDLLRAFAQTSKNAAIFSLIGQRFGPYQSNHSK